MDAEATLAHIRELARERARRYYERHAAEVNARITAARRKDWPAYLASVNARNARKRQRLAAAEAAAAAEDEDPIAVEMANDMTDLMDDVLSGAMGPA
jgi:hypothetical protein